MNTASASAISSHGPITPVWDEKQLRAANRAAGVALWSWNVNTDAFTMDERAYDLWEIPANQRVTFEILSKKIHPVDLARVRSAFAATRAAVGAYEIDFRILCSGGDGRWISARGQGDDEGIKNRIMFGVFLDVTQRKQAEEALELLAGEMSHRVTNILQIATALTHITSRSTTSKEDMAHALTHRLGALGRAHALVRPGGRKNESMLLGDLVSILLAPYDDRGHSSRIRVSVPKMNVGEESGTVLALIIHELATNSAKYGSLSTPSGILDVSCTSHDDHVVILWTERGGPSVVARSMVQGFGSKLVHRMAAQLGGPIVFDWSAEGVVVTLQISKDTLAG